MRKLAIAVLAIACLAARADERAGWYMAEGDAYAEAFADAQLWFDASYPATFSASSDWTNLGRLGGVATNAGTNTVTFSAGAQNGHGAVMTRTGSWLDFPQTTVTNGAVTVIAVFRRSAAGKVSAPLSGGNSAIIFVGTDNRAVAQWGTGYKVETSASTSTGVCLYVATSASTDISGVAMSRNGTPISFGAPNAFHAATVLLTLGRYAALFHNDHLMLVAAWYRELSADEIDAKSAVINERWGL